MDSSEYIYNTLIKLGYEPRESGDYYRCSALYRNGDNPSSLSINRETGRWTDFVNGLLNERFEKLVKLTLGEEGESFVEKFLRDEEVSIHKTLKKNDFMENDYYPTECLKKLIGLYTFYEKKGISPSTQKAYSCGFASSGKLYGRVVFPIFDKSKSIVGFAGRYVYDLKGKIPKWKIIGKKKNFVYPFYSPSMESRFMEDFEKEREVVLVESIGDSMALYQNGIRNNLVCFGLNGMDSVMGFLSSINPNKITISFNNDCEKERNSGLLGAIKCYFNLNSFFGDDRAIIKLPNKNDFGDMASFISEDPDIFNKWKNRKINVKLQKKHIFKIVEEDSLKDSSERFFNKKIYDFANTFLNENE